MPDEVKMFNSTKAKYYKNLSMYYEPLEIRFSGKPSESQIIELKDAGFRARKDAEGNWLWRAYDNHRARAYAEKNATNGGEIGKKMIPEEKLQQQLDRSEKRTDRLHYKAEKARDEGRKQLDKANQMAEIIPLGQPIMGIRDRNYRDKIHATEGRGWQKMEEAQKLEYQSKAAERFGARKMNPTTIRRRIERLETQIRVTLLHIDKEIGEWLFLRVYNGGQYAKQLSRKSLEQQEALIPDLEEELAFWRKYVQGAGIKTWSKGDFGKGDLVRYEGTLYVVEKVNPKGLRLWNPARHDYWEHWKAKYIDLRQDCKDVSDEDRRHMDEVIMRAHGQTGPASE